MGAKFNDKDSNCYGILMVVCMVCGSNLKDALSNKAKALFL